MSRKRRPIKTEAKPEPKPEPQPLTRKIEWYRHCPLCWAGHGGYGVAYSTEGATTYYKCSKSTSDKGPCGHTWTAKVVRDVVRVEHRRVTLNER